MLLLVLSVDDANGMRYAIERNARINLLMMAIFAVLALDRKQLGRKMTR